MSKTEENLKEAFAGESQANRKYLAFAQKAREEGFPGVAKLFEAAAAAETIHAHKHLRVLKGIRSTRENLEEAVSGETHEFKSMYPKMIEEAQAEGHKQAEISFSYANEVEKVHAELYKEALKDLENFPIKDWYICPICGYTVADEPPERCPVCGAKKEKFSKVA
ncbi:MAG: rubrerythrin family protein [Thermodesulfobacteriota bacterium]|nr:rubrerythrin family protein [Thermodesulfobacteriota bacterium]